jgi:hypothetical protein
VRSDAQIIGEAFAAMESDDEAQPLAPALRAAWNGNRFDERAMDEAITAIARDQEPPA